MAIPTSSPAAAVRVALGNFDKGDFKAFTALATDDAQGVDEIARRWIRGRDDLSAYMTQIEGSLKDIHSELKDVHEAVHGDIGLVTCWLEQDYTLEGKREHVSAPTTVVLRRAGHDWRIALFHSVPLPPAS